MKSLLDNLTHIIPQLANIRGLSLFALLILMAGCDSPKKPEKQFEVARVGLNAGSLSSDGKQAIVGSIHHGISLWRTTDNERLFDWSHKKKETTTMVASAFSDNGEWAVTADVSSLVLWRVATGTAERFWQAPSTILAVDINRTASYALIGLADHTAILFDIRHGGIVQTLHHNNRVRSVDLSHNGRFALTGSEDYRAIYWDVGRGEILQSMQHNDDVQLVKLSDDNALALSVSKYDRATIWETSSGESLGELSLKSRATQFGLRFTSARFSEDNTLLLTGRPDQIVTLWQVQDLKRLHQWQVAKRKAWKPQGAAIIDVSFTGQPGEFRTLSSNGFLSYLKQ